MKAPSQGLVALYRTPGEALRAAEQVRDAGYKFWDVHSPFPVHGMDRAMGLRRSRVSRFALAGGVVGLAGGMLFIAWSALVNSPLFIGGKPHFSPLFAFPVSFELTLLFGALATVAGLLLLNRLPRHHHPVMDHPHFARITDDSFLIVIEARDPRFHPENTRRLLERSGGLEVADLDS